MEKALKRSLRQRARARARTGEDFVEEQQARAVMTKLGCDLATARRVVAEAKAAAVARHNARVEAEIEAAGAALQ